MGLRPAAREDRMKTVGKANQLPAALSVPKVEMTFAGRGATCRNYCNRKILPRLLEFCILSGMLVKVAKREKHALLLQLTYYARGSTQMKQSRFGMVAAGAVCAAALMFGASEANAGWGSHGSSGGSYGSSGGSYGSSGGSSGGYGSYGSWGSHHYTTARYGSSGGSYGGSSGGSYGGSSGGWFSRWHCTPRVHHHRVRVYHSSGGSYGSHGSSGGSYGSSGGKVIYSSPIQSGKVYSSPVQSGKSYSAPIESGDVPATPAPPAPPAATEQTSTAREATLTVNVPSDARVYVNGVQTKSVGSERSYVSRGLRAGFNYSYEVRAAVERDGKLVEETKMVSLQAGRNARVAFAFEANATAPSTTLTLNVPADAKVFLAGHETTSSGEVREFTTAKLAAGQSWENYTVRVDFEQDGQTVSREKTITLTAGEDQIVSFDGEAPLVAAVN